MSPHKTFIISPCVTLLSSIPLLLFLLQYTKSFSLIKVPNFQQILYVHSILLPQKDHILDGQCPCDREKFHVLSKASYITCTHSTLNNSTPPAAIFLLLTWGILHPWPILPQIILHHPIYSRSDSCDSSDSSNRCNISDSGESSDSYTMQINYIYKYNFLTKICTF